MGKQRQQQGTSMAGHMVTITSSDEREFKVDVNILVASETVKSMMGLDDEPPYTAPEEAIPLPAVDGNTLERVIKYMTYHYEHKEGKDEDKAAWDAEFVKLDDDALFSLILAANYMDIKGLLDLTCKTVANYIKECKTPQEIRRRFNIKNDFTPEEEEEVRKENAWCEER